MSTTMYVLWRKKKILTLVLLNPGIPCLQSVHHFFFIWSYGISDLYDEHLVFYVKDDYAP